MFLNVSPAEQETAVVSLLLKPFAVPPSTKLEYFLEND